MKSRDQTFYPQLCLYFGIIGTIGFAHMVLIFLQDWIKRYADLVYFIPVPIVLLVAAKFFPRISGFLLVFLGAAAVAFDYLYSPSHPGAVAGRGVGYTIVFIALPLIISGILYIFRGSKQSREPG